MTDKTKPFFIVFDGIDGAGKGAAIKTALEYFKKQKNTRWLDLDEYWQKNHRHPQTTEKYSKKTHKLNDDYISLEDIDLIQASEPTYTDIGNAIRNSIIKNKGEYSAKFTAEMYAADRNVLYTQLLIPALNSGKIWIQSRSFSTSMTYQSIQAQELKETLTIEQMLSYEGNQLAIKHPPNLLVITTIQDLEQAQERIKKRNKDDNTFFENIEFQKKLKQQYESTQLKEFFEKLGTKVEYADSGTEIQEYQQQVQEIVKKHYEGKI